MSKTLCKLVKFDNKEELENYFQKLFQDINQLGVFNIYVHQVNDFHECDTRHLSKRTLIKRRVAAIIKNGLLLDAYSTLTGTTQLVCNTQNIKLDKLFEYNYYNCATYKALCIYALPKFISIDGKMVEFSSYKGLTSYDFPKELMEEYKRQTSVPVRHHLKCSLFDAIKGYGSMPKHYSLGVLQFEDEKVSFIKTSPHLYEMDEAMQQLHNRTMERKVKNLYEKFGTDKTEEVIVKAYMEEEKWRDEQALMEI